jgi:hypothetical protein
MRHFSLRLLVEKPKYTIAIVWGIKGLHLWKHTKNRGLKLAESVVRHRVEVDQIKAASNLITIKKSINDRT